MATLQYIHEGEMFADPGSPDSGFKSMNYFTTIDPFTEALRGPRMPSECWLYYDNISSIKIDRNTMSKTCRYFEVLLNGTYIEGRQPIIHLKLSDMFSYEAFACIIHYGNNNQFLPDPDKLDVYIEAIQLCVLWDYEDCKDLLMHHLATQLSVYTITDIMGVAMRHKYSLGNLIRACEEFERSVPFQTCIPESWVVRCAIDHDEDKPHHYMNCARLNLRKKIEAELEAEWIKSFWDEESTKYYKRNEEEIEQERMADTELRERRRFGLRGSEPPEYSNYYLNYL